MREGTKRSIVRGIHIVFSIPILGYIYSPFEEIPKYAPRVRLIPRKLFAIEAERSNESIGTN